jgi:hypothetical protein
MSIGPYDCSLTPSALRRPYCGGLFLGQRPCPMTARGRPATFTPQVRLLESGHFADDARRAIQRAAQSPPMVSCKAIMPVSRAIGAPRDIVSYGLSLDSDGD